MTLFVHRADRSDRLVDALAELLADPLPDVMAMEVVAVPARGIERWITQQLAHRLGATVAGGPAGGPAGESGVCAGVRFTSPARLVAEIVGGRSEDPWAPDRLVWPLLAAIDEAMGQDWAATLTRHLGAGTDPERRGRRYAVARRLAGLFDSYANFRPDVIADWSDGGFADGTGGEVPPDLAWQPRLWRAVRALMADLDPVQRAAAALDAVRRTPSALELPARVSVFGATRLPPAQLAVLDAIADGRDVHLWLPQPSVVLGSKVLRDRPTGRILRRADPTAIAAQHPLLASLGRESRELLLGLPVGAVDDAVDRDHDDATLLHRLQGDIAADRPPREVPLEQDDRTVQIHACHGPARQVEVLRDVILGLLVRDRTLEPRDVLVMCPDIEEYAPLIAAAFGLADVVDDGHPGHTLRVRLADRALKQTNPLIGLTFRLMELVRGRIRASDVLDLAASAPVRRCFRFSDTDLETVRAWVAASGIRWGLDAEHRAPYGLQSLPQNTWRAGLDRILLGVAMADEPTASGGNHLGLAAPLDDVGSSDIALVGRLAEFVDRLGSAIDALSAELPLTAWIDRIITAVDSLTEVTVADLWQRTELTRQLAEINDDAVDLGERTTLAAADVQAMLAGRLAGRPTRSNFRTGSLTVCTMVPMRSVPHRVICLLGLDDGVFPRGAGVDGDDLLARSAAVGERDPRAEDRQLLLDAIMAATDTLVITYTGADPRTGATRPPAVPLGELISTLEESTGGQLGPPVIIRHPLQPYDVHAVLPDALGVSGPFTFDRAALAGARAAAGPRTPPPPFLTGVLPARQLDVVSLDDLVRFLGHPVRGFLRERLGISTFDEQDGPGDEMVAELDQLEQWHLGDRLLRQRLAGLSFADATGVEWRRGGLPPGKLGSSVLDKVGRDLEPVVAAATAVRTGERRSVDLLVTLPDGTTVTGTVAGVHGDRLVTAGYSKLGPRARLEAWVRLLALAAARPGIGWRTTTIGRRRSGVGAQVAELSAPGVDAATEELTRLVAIYRAGLRVPLPAPVKSSEAFAATIAQRGSVAMAEQEARRAWTSNKFPAEDAEPPHRLVWGPGLSFDRLLALAPPAGIDAGSDITGRGSWFGALATEIWLPLLDVEHVGAP